MVYSRDLTIKNAGDEGVLLTCALTEAYSRNIPRDWKESHLYKSKGPLIDQQFQRNNSGFSEKIFNLMFASTHHLR